MSASSICVGVLLKLMLPSMGVWLLLLALLPRSPGGESDIVMVLKRPRISRRSCDTWSLGSVVRSEGGIDRGRWTPIKRQCWSTGSFGVILRFQARFHVTVLFLIQDR